MDSNYTHYRKLAKVTQGRLICAEAALSFIDEKEDFLFPGSKILRQRAIHQVQRQRYRLMCLNMAIAILDRRQLYNTSTAEIMQRIGLEVYEANNTIYIPKQQFHS